MELESPKMRQTQITINVELDENHVPEKNDLECSRWWCLKIRETKATMISVWDDKAMEALRIDLWTKDMPVDQMKMFLHRIFCFSSSYLSKSNWPR